MLQYFSTLQTNQRCIHPFRYLLMLIILGLAPVARAQLATTDVAERATRAFLNSNYDQAQLLAMRPCEQGNQRACAVVALLHGYGFSVPQNSEKGLTMAQKLCAEGSAAGCTASGKLIYDGVGTNVDKIAAYRLFEHACNGDDPLGCQQQASALYYGQGTATDRELAARLYLRACDRGNGRACNDLGWFYLDGSVFSKSYDRALALYQRGCSLEFFSACRSVGYMYTNGFGVDRNYTRAMQIYQKACSMGNQTACADLTKVRQIAAANPAQIGNKMSGVGPSARQIRDALVFENTYGVTTGADALGLAQRQANYEVGLSRTTMFGMSIDVRYQVSNPHCQPKRSDEYICDYDYNVTTMGLTSGARATHTFVHRADRWRSPTFQAALVESARRNASRRSSERNCTVQGFGTLEGPHLADAQGLSC